MTISTAASRPRRTWVIGVVAVGALIVLAALCLFGFLWDDNHGEGVIIGATIGTALGTLALAGTTYLLARETRRAVAESGAELVEIQAQRVLLERQADSATAQAASSAAAALAAEKARVDAISPLLYCEVSLGTVSVFETDQPTVFPNAEWKRPASYLPNIRFDVELVYRLENVGSAPARLSFGGTSWHLEQRQKKNLNGIDLKPGDTYADTYMVRLSGQEAVDGKLIRMPFTYEGTMHGEMFDRVQSKGWVTGAKLDGMDAVLHDLILNAGGALVIRDYPNIERPDEMRTQRESLLDDTDPRADGLVPNGGE